ncbi:unnamed protein product [Paramecium octaurelia]|uniref:Tetratricopeptide repeat protein n=1 Tax=Paramecium octaurelia TaxID=43137 RepID=A0A8S1YJX4_PAROT|nr:unnamed protein product [Paramecium octaurelia]
MKRLKSLDNLLVVKLGFIENSDFFLRRGEKLIFKKLARSNSQDQIVTSTIFQNAQQTAIFYYLQFTILVPFYSDLFHTHKMFSNYLCFAFLSRSFFFIQSKLSLPNRICLFFRLIFQKLVFKFPTCSFVHLRGPNIPPNLVSKLPLELKLFSTFPFLFIHILILIQFLQFLVVSFNCDQNNYLTPLILQCFSMHFLEFYFYCPLICSPYQNLFGQEFTDHKLDSPKFQALPKFHTLYITDDFPRFLNALISPFQIASLTRKQLLLPEDSNYYNGKAETLKYLNRFEEALENYDLAIQKNPEDFDYYINKAITLDEMDRFEEALEHFDLAIQKNLEDPDYYNYKAVTLDKMNRLEEALKYYDLAIQKNPEESYFYFNKANTLDKMNRLKDALENYDLAIQKNPQDSNYYYGKADVLKQMNRFEEAQKYYKLAASKQRKLK